MSGSSPKMILRKRGKIVQRSKGENLEHVVQLAPWFNYLQSPL